MRGLFISVEGVEGSGKTTVVKALADWISQNELEVIVTAEPGGTDLGERIRQLLLDPHPSSLIPHPLSEAFLFFADRADHVAKVIRPALEQGKIVLCDRFADSTFAYQSFGLGLSLGLLKGLNGIATGGVMPDLTLLLDIDPEIGLQRIQKKTVFERYPLPFHQRVRWGYLWLAKHEPNRIKVIDAGQTMGAVLAQAKTLAEEAIASWRFQASSATNTP